MGTARLQLRRDDPNQAATRGHLLLSCEHTHQRHCGRRCLGGRCAGLNGDVLLGCATISGGCQLRRCLLRQFHQHSAEPVLSDLDTVGLAQAAAPVTAAPPLEVQ